MPESDERDGGLFSSTRPGVRTTTLARSVSPYRVAGGAALALGAGALAAAGVVTSSPVVAATTGVLFLVVALGGVQRFRETVAYHLLQALAFGT